MDLLFPHDDRDRLEFKESAMKIGFEELTAECAANMHLLQPHDRLSVLLIAWKKIGDHLTQNQYAPCVGNVVSWVGRYTLDLWFGRDWITCSGENKTSLVEHMMKVYPAAYINMHPYSWPYMFSIYRDPWMVEYLNLNFQRMNGPDQPDTLESKDSDFIQQEGISLILLRMIKMFDFNMIKLVKHICFRLLLAWHDSTSLANRAMRATPNSAQYMDYMRHIYLIAICESNGTKDLHYVLECIKRNQHSNTIETGPLETVAEIIAKGLHESDKTLMEFINAFLLQVPDRHFNNSFGGVVEKYVAFLTEYQLEKLHSLSSHKLLLPYDKAYEKLVKMFIKQRESSEELMKTTAVVSEKLFSGVHNLKALKYSYEEMKHRTRSEWHTTKLTLIFSIISEELNILEESKYIDGQVVGDLIINEQYLAGFYRDLAKLLTKTPYLEQEAWLTSFSLYPCKEYMDAVTRCGSKNLRAVKKQAQKLNVLPCPEPKPLKNPAEDPKSVVNNSDENKALEIKPPALPPYDSELPSTSAAFLANFGSIDDAKVVNPTTIPITDSKPEIVAKTDKPVKVKKGPRNKTQNLKSTKTIIKAKRGRPFGKVNSLKLVGKNAGKALKLTDIKNSKEKPIISKANPKYKDSAEVIYAAAAGAAQDIFSQTVESIQYPAFALINSVTDTEDLVKYTDYSDEIAQYKELNRILSNLHLEHSNHDDLLVLIVSPRYKRLTWSICWKILRKRCRELLTKDKKKQQLVEQCMADANDRLTHLDIDYDKYKDKPQIDYGTIERGYECFDTESADDTLTPVIADPHRPKKSKLLMKKIMKRNISVTAMQVAGEIDISDEEEQRSNEKIVKVLSQETLQPNRSMDSLTVPPETIVETSATRYLSSPIFLSRPVYIVRRPVGNLIDTESPLGKKPITKYQLDSSPQVDIQNIQTIRGPRIIAKSIQPLASNSFEAISAIATDKQAASVPPAICTVAKSTPPLLEQPINCSQQLLQPSYPQSTLQHNLTKPTFTSPQKELQELLSNNTQKHLLNMPYSGNQQQRMNISSFGAQNSQNNMRSNNSLAKQPNVLFPGISRHQPSVVSCIRQQNPFTLQLEQVKRQQEQILQQVQKQQSQLSHTNINQGNILGDSLSKPFNITVPNRTEEQPEDLTMPKVSNVIPPKKMTKLPQMQPLNLTSKTPKQNILPPTICPNARSEGVCPKKFIAVPLTQITCDKSHRIRTKFNKTNMSFIVENSCPACKSEKPAEPIIKVIEPFILRRTGNNITTAVVMCQKPGPNPANITIPSSYIPICQYSRPVPLLLTTPVPGQPIAWSSISPDKINHVLANIGKNKPSRVFWATPKLGPHAAGTTEKCSARYILTAKNSLASSASTKATSYVPLKCPKPGSTYQIAGQNTRLTSPKPGPAVVINTAFTSPCVLGHTNRLINDNKPLTNILLANPKHPHSRSSPYVLERGTNILINDNKPLTNMLLTNPKHPHPHPSPCVLKRGENLINDNKPLTNMLLTNPKHPHPHPSPCVLERGKNILINDNKPLTNMLLTNPKQGPTPHTPPYVLGGTNKPRTTLLLTSPKKDTSTVANAAFTPANILGERKILLNEKTRAPFNVLLTNPERGTSVLAKTVFNPVYILGQKKYLVIKANTRVPSNVLLKSPKPGPSPCLLGVQNNFTSNNIKTYNSPVIRIIDKRLNPSTNAPATSNATSIPVTPNHVPVTRSSTALPKLQLSNEPRKIPSITSALSHVVDENRMKTVDVKNKNPSFTRKLAEKVAAKIARSYNPETRYIINIPEVVKLLINIIAAKKMTETPLSTLVTNLLDETVKCSTVNGEQKELATFNIPETAKLLLSIISTNKITTVPFLSSSASVPNAEPKERATEVDNDTINQIPTVAESKPQVLKSPLRMTLLCKKVDSALTVRATAKKITLPKNPTLETTYPAKKAKIAESPAIKSTDTSTANYKLKSTTIATITKLSTESEKMETSDIETTVIKETVAVSDVPSIFAPLTVETDLSKIEKLSLNAPASLLSIHNQCEHPTDDILYDKDKVFNTKLLDPHLKTYKNNKATNKTVEKMKTHTATEDIVTVEPLSVNFSSAGENLLHIKDDLTINCENPELNLSEKNDLPIHELSLELASPQELPDNTSSTVDENKEQHLPSKSVKPLRCPINPRMCVELDFSKESLEWEPIMCKMSEELPSTSSVSRDGSKSPALSILKTALACENQKDALVDPQLLLEPCSSKDIQNALASFDQETLNQFANYQLELNANPDEIPNTRSNAMEAIKNAKVFSHPWCQAVASALSQSLQPTENLPEIKKVIDNLKIQGKRSLRLQNLSPISRGIVMRARYITFNLAFLAERSKFVANLGNEDPTEGKEESATFLMSPLEEIPDVTMLISSIIGRDISNDMDIAAEEIPFSDDVLTKTGLSKVLMGRVLKVTINGKIFKASQNNSIERQSRQKSVDLCKALDDFARSRRDANSPTLYSPGISKKGILNGSVPKMVIYFPETTTRKRRGVQPSPKMESTPIEPAVRRSSARSSPAATHLIKDNQPAKTGTEKRALRSLSRAEIEPSAQRTSTPGCSTRARKKQVSQDESEEISDEEVNRIYECATISTTNDSDDDTGSDYVPRTRRQRVVKPMRLRCISRRPNPADFTNESSSCSSVITVRQTRRFAAKSTARNVFSARCASTRSSLLLTRERVPTPIKRNKRRSSALERAAILRYNCTPLEVRLYRLTTREAEMCRKPHIRVARCEFTEYLKKLRTNKIKPQKYQQMEIDGEEAVSPEEDTEEQKSEEEYETDQEQERRKNNVDKIKDPLSASEGGEEEELGQAIQHKPEEEDEEELQLEKVLEVEQDPLSGSEGEEDSEHGEELKQGEEIEQDPLLGFEGLEEKTVEKELKKEQEDLTQRKRFQKEMELKQEIEPKQDIQIELEEEDLEEEEELDDEDDQNEDDEDKEENQEDQGDEEDEDPEKEEDDDEEENDDDKEDEDEEDTDEEEENDKDEEKEERKNDGEKEKKKKGEKEGEGDNSVSMTDASKTDSSDSDDEDHDDGGGVRSASKNVASDRCANSASSGSSTHEIDVDPRYAFCSQLSLREHGNQVCCHHNTVPMATRVSIPANVPVPSSVPTASNVPVATSVPSATNVPVATIGPMATNIPVATNVPMATSGSSSTHETNGGHYDYCPQYTPPREYGNQEFGLYNAGPISMGSSPSTYENNATRNEYCQYYTPPPEYENQGYNNYRPVHAQQRREKPYERKNPKVYCPVHDAPESAPSEFLMTTPSQGIEVRTPITQTVIRMPITQPVTHQVIDMSVPPQLQNQNVIMPQGQNCNVTYQPSLLPYLPAGHTVDQIYAPEWLMGQQMGRQIWNINIHRPIQTINYNASSSTSINPTQPASTDSLTNPQQPPFNQPP